MKPEKKIDPIIDRYLKNEVFTHYPIILEDGDRDEQPALKDPAEKLQVWNLLKECIGQDLSKMSQPVYLNEPFSQLQRYSDCIEYKNLLDKAADCNNNQWMRQIYVAAYFYMSYSGLHSRLKKPFNPLLGETWEWVKDDFKYLAEQVSHHPPVMAYMGKTPRYKVYGDYKVKTNLSFSGFKVKTFSDFFVEFNDNNDVFVIKKPKCIVKNIVMGTTFNWVHGDLTGTAIAFI